MTAFFFFIARWLIRRVRILRLRGDDTPVRCAHHHSYCFSLYARGRIRHTDNTGNNHDHGLHACPLHRTGTKYHQYDRFQRPCDSPHLPPFSLFTLLLITFASVVFIIVFARKVYPRLRVQNHIVNWLILSISMTVSATIGTLPIVLYRFWAQPFFRRTQPRSCASFVHFCHALEPCRTCHTLR